MKDGFHEDHEGMMVAVTCYNVCYHTSKKGWKGLA
jgi:hypothetical protein